MSIQIVVGLHKFSYSLNNIICTTIVDQHITALAVKTYLLSIFGHNTWTTKIVLDFETTKWTKLIIAKGACFK